MQADEYAKKLEEVLPQVAERAEEAEALRRIPDATLQALRESGLLKAL